MTKVTTFNFEPDASRLVQAIETPDEIGAVIRIHFEIDRALEHIVDAMVPAASHLRHQYMESRIRFLFALGMPEIRLAPAKIINEIRNKFAHHEKDGISPSDITKLSAAVNALLGKEIPTHFAVRDKRASADKEWVYGDMSLKEKFCLLGYLALAGVATIENDFEKVSFNQTTKTDL
jgi:hypothetical protein